MALSRDVVIRLLGDANSAVAAQKAAADAAGVTAAQYRKAEREYDKSQKAMESASRKQRAAMEDVGRASMIAGATIVAGLGMAVKAAMDWESSWTGVLKTVNGSPAQLAKLETGLRGLTRVLPATHTEIAAVAEAAGQLGIKTDSIVDFTRTMVNLGETTNLSADEAATSLAQLMNVMGTAPKDVGRLGATLVALGNAGASTEADIVHMASYITGSAKLIGASESSVLALSNAMTSMGINAERGGGVMTRVMQDMYSAVQSGGDQLNGFAKVAGMSAQDFAKAFKDDPIRAIDSFVKGLGTVESSGGNVVETLSNLGYVGTQDTAVLLQLKGAGNLLTDSLNLGNEAWKQNTALVIEAAKRYDTTAAKTEMARNAINDAAIQIGDVFLPVLASLADGVADVAKWFADLPAPLQGAMGGLAGVAGVGALVGGAFLLLAPRVMELYKSFQLLNETAPNLASNLGKLGKAAGVAAGLAILGTAVSALDDAMAPAPQTMQKYVASILDLDNGIAGLDKRFSGLDKGLDTDITGFADAIKRITDPSSAERLNDFGGALFNVATFGGAGTGEGAASRRRVLEEIDGLDQALALMVQNGNGDLAAHQFEVMAAEAERNGVSLAQLKELFPGYADALKGIDNDQKTAAASAQTQAQQAATLAQNLDVAYGSLEGYAAALGLSEDATKDLIQKSQELGQSLGDFIDPLGTYTGLLQQKAQAEADAANKTAEKTGASSKSWEDFKNSVHVTFGEYMADLQAQVDAQSNWQLNMLMLAGRVSAGTLAELARMGPEGAPLVADLVTKSDAELDKMDGLFAQRSKEATDAWGAQLTMAAPVLAEIARKGGQGASDAAAAALRNGTATLASIAAQWGVTIAGGINPILSGLGKPRITTSGWDATGFMGPVQLKNAEGNLYEDHSAQIAPGGAWRVWAEPETGGEAYIPLHPSKRDRSLSIWRETGRRLGADAQYFAAGGFTSVADVPKPASTAPARAPYSTVADAAMQKVYDETVAWVTANMASSTGPLGSGSAPGGWQSIFTWVKSRIPEARVNSAYRPGDPGYHGKGKAVDFGFGSAAGGNGSAGLALINRTLHDGLGANLAELIYDGVGDDRPDLKNGKPLTYSAATQAEHHNHVHAANYAKGGIYNPHVRDTGGPLLPGYTYNGLGRPEMVMPTMPVGGSTVVIQLDGAAVNDLFEGKAVEVVTAGMSIQTSRGSYNG